MSAEVIKARLLDLLVPSNPRMDCIVVSELAFLGGRCKADLVEVSDCLSAYEIKSEKDSFSRLKAQLSLYSLTFDYVTLVLDENLYRRLPSYVSKKVGIVVFEDAGSMLSWVRAPLRFERPRKFHLSMFLWRSDLERALASANSRFRADDDVHSLRLKLVREFTFEEIHRLALKAIRKRYFSRFERFMSERGSVTHIEDVALLSALDHDISL
jgi:hypothetical protein